MKMLYNDFHAGTKFVQAQTFWGANFLGLKFLGDQISWGPFKPGVQMRSGTISVIAQKVQTHFLQKILWFLSDLPILYKITVLISFSIELF